MSQPNDQHHLIQELDQMIEAARQAPMITRPQHAEKIALWTRGILAHLFRENEALHAHISEAYRIQVRQAELLTEQGRKIDLLAREAGLNFDQGGAHAAA